ncbi:InlB B-repeat-containing protein [Chitinispirillales bacterium ANBcel5]|uniref:InlB B-repeat-containing protein n=1 Tax=Cellulosispirillum alkaliphilum TaxID=3039283 RepID=UPI002A52FD9D|nr:InlB B-repeat-containing protein [Chitinispirillales bacterium ANBcel5]
MRRYLLFLLCPLVFFSISCEQPEDPIERASLDDLYLHDEDSRIVAGEPFEVVLDLIGGNYIETITVEYGDSRDKKIIDYLKTDDWEDKLLLPLTYDSADTYKLVITVEFLRNVKRVAELELKVYPGYSVIYNSTEHISGDVPQDTMFYKTGESVTVLGNSGALSREGFEFIGWSTDNDSSSAIVKAEDTLIIDGEDINLYARWTKVSDTDNFTVTFDYNYDSVVTTQIVADGALLEKPSEPQKREGYTFEGWYSDQNMDEKWDFEEGVITSDTNLFAYWNVITYQISYTLNGGSNHDDNPNSYTIESEAISIKNASREGFSFLGWFVDTVRISQIESGSTGDLTLEAKWTEDPVFFIAYHGNGNTDGSAPDTAFYEEGAEVTVSGAGSLTRTGHQFMGWNTDPHGEGDSFDPNDTFEMGADDLILHAQWELNEYTVSFYTGEEDLFKTQIVQHGSYAKEPSETPVKEGYRFAGWFGNSALTNPFDFNERVITNDRTIYAKWIPLFSVVYHANGADTGKVPLDSNLYNEGRTVLVSNNSASLYKEGFSFAGWNTSPDGTGAARLPGETFMMPSSNINLYAMWELNPPEVIVQPSDMTVTAGEGLILSVEARCPETSSSELSYQWKKDGVEIEGANEAYLTIDSTLFSHAGTYSCRINNRAGGVISENAIVTVIPPGMVHIESKDKTFSMGHINVASPVHQVTITYDFWMGETPVTQEEFEAVMGFNPSFFEGSQKPVTLNRLEAVRYCNELSKLHGLDTVYIYDELTSWGDLTIDYSKNGYRLPTEAEWEFAARGGTTTYFFWGTQSDTSAAGDYAWYRGNSNDRTHPVRQKLPNAFGLYDIMGNVYEYCNDYRGEYTSDPKVDPRGPSDGLYLVYRGGAYWHRAENLSVADRTFSTRVEMKYLGFRIVLPKQ